MRKTMRLYGFINNFSTAFNKKNITDYAASAAFFLFLSLIPLLMAFFSILPYTGITENQFVAVITDVAPDTMDAFVIDIIDEIYVKSAGIITVSIVVIIWSAGKGMQSLIRGLNSIYDIAEDRGYFILRGLACLYTVIMIVATFIMVFLLMFGRYVLNILVSHIPQLLYIKKLLLYLRYPIGIIVLIVLFTAIYCLVPSKKQKFIKQLPGAIISGVTWMLASIVFAFYLENFDGFSTYGSMATVIILMIYMYMMMYILLIGAYVNYWLGRSQP